MKHQRILVAIVLGAVCYVLLRYANHAVMASFPPQRGLSVAVIVSAPFGMLISLLPGFIAGWLSQERGILAGFIVGVLGAMLYAVFTGTVQADLSSNSGVSLGVLVFWVALAYFVSGVFGAAAGGAAQLVRSNRSSKRTREKPRAA